MLMHFTKNVENMKDYFHHRVNNPPVHSHLPFIASKLMWLEGIKSRIGVSTFPPKRI